MIDAETFADNTHLYKAGRFEDPDIVTHLRRWVRTHSKAVRDLGSRRTLRCYASILSARGKSPLLSVEFAAADGGSHTLPIHADGGFDLGFAETRVASLEAAINLLALLTSDLGIAVSLQP